MSKNLPVVVLAIPLLVALAALPAIAEEPGLDGPALLSATGSERATTGLGNLIVTRDNKTHVVWLDNDPASGEYRAKAATLDRASARWSAPVVLSKAFDNHSRPCLAVDEQGFLHVVVSGHNTPFQYLKSVKPNDSAAWTKPIPIQKGTYPFLLAGSDDTLWLSGRTERQRGIQLLSKQGEGRWTLAATPFGREDRYKDYGGYNTQLAWDSDRERLHLAADVYESPTAKRRGEHQAVVYLASDDGGKTWQRADGSIIEGGRVAGNTDVLAESNHKREGAKAIPRLRLGGLALDDEGRPVILYSNSEEEPGRVLLVTPDLAGKWKELGLSEAARRYAPDCSASGQKLTRTADGRLLAILSFQPTASARTETSAEDDDDAGSGVRTLLVESSDHGTTWAFKPLVPKTAGEPIAPSLERVSGYNRVGEECPPGLLYFTGLARYRQPGEVIQNKVFFVPIR